MKNIVQQSRHHLATFLFSLLSILLVMAGCDEQSKPNNGGGTTADTLVAPTIASQSASVKIVEGNTATLSVSATHPTVATLTYQWKTATKGSTNFSDIASATSASYTTSALTYADSGVQYKAEVKATSNGVTKATLSNVATISVSPKLPAKPTLDPARVVFKMGADDTIIGMREFLLTVSFSGITTGAKDSLDFIVSESTTAPDYETKVKTSPARIRRTFTDTKTSREIYFSVTDQVTSAGLSALSNNTITVTATNELADMRTNAAGFMAPGGSYYVHAYYQGRPVKTSPLITTLSRPATYPASMTDDNTTETTFLDKPDPLVPSDTRSPEYWAWNMSVWRERSASKAYERIEVREGELYFVPFRYVYPINAENPPPYLSWGILYPSEYFQVIKVVSSVTYVIYRFTATETTSSVYTLPTLDKRVSGGGIAVGFYLSGGSRYNMDAMIQYKSDDTSASNMITRSDMRDAASVRIFQNPNYFLPVLVAE